LVHLSVYATSFCILIAVLVYFFNSDLRKLILILQVGADADVILLCHQCIPLSPSLTSESV